MILKGDDAVLIEIHNIFHLSQGMWQLSFSSLFVRLELCMEVNTLIRVVLNFIFLSISQEGFRNIDRLILFLRSFMDDTHASITRGCDTFDSTSTATVSCHVDRLGYACIISSLGTTEFCGRFSCKKRSMNLHFVSIYLKILRALYLTHS